MRKFTQAVLAELVSIGEIQLDFTFDPQEVLLTSPEISEMLGKKGRLEFPDGTMVEGDFAVENQDPNTGNLSCVLYNLADVGLLPEFQRWETDGGR